MTDQNLVELLTLNNDLLVSVNTQLQRIAEILQAQHTQQPLPVLQAPVPPAVQQAGWVCPVHGVSRVVPAGVSSRTGQPYQAFVVCSVQGCQERPPRAPQAVPLRALPPVPGQMP